MQASSFAFDIQMIDSSVKNAMYTVVPINSCVSAAFGSDKIELGSQILKCSKYLLKQIKNNSFGNEEYNYYIEMKSYYNLFISMCF
jgi:hypothetical protein